MNQEVWWVQSLMPVWVIVFYKVQEWHACIADSRSHLARLFGFWIIKISKTQFTWWYFQNRLLTWIIDEAGGVVDATPKGMGHHIL